MFSSAYAAPSDSQAPLVRAAAAAPESANKE